MGLGVQRLNKTVQIVGLALLVAACGKEQLTVNDLNRVVLDSAKPVQEIGDAEMRFGVYPNNKLYTQEKAGNVSLLPSAEAKDFLNTLANRSTVSAITPLKGRVAKEETKPSTTAATSLVLGYPVSLLGESQIFGGVITKVSDKTSETLGRLKLTDLPPIHVRTAISKDQKDNYVLLLVGCVSKCEENSMPSALFGIPVVGVDTANEKILVDLSALGAGMNLVDFFDPSGAYTQLKTKESKTSLFDFSASTLVFDVDATMVPVKPPTTGAVPETTITSRWYLRLASVFDPAFEPREPADGVGFFNTQRGLKTRITRFSRSTYPGVQYYIKNVPKEYQKAFASAFDKWNETFTNETGRPLIKYEFVDATDPRSQLIVTGDIRYNVVEWDLNNLAPYGGLGPSIANQYTGQILSANVLVQGPHIVELYSKWFGVTQRADNLRALGQTSAAERLVRDFYRSLAAKEETSKHTLKLTLGDQLEFRIPAQLPQYQDPAFATKDFDAPPTGFTYETYMEGYFHELVTHEMGHNVGLRHNFRGNLYSDDVPSKGKVSTSVMEYLNRNFRHLNDIGDYDLMAIRYGYKGVQPTHTDRFCTDENVATEAEDGNSAECSRDDATNDPFGFFEQRLNRAITLLTARGTADAPVWEVKDMSRELGIALNGMGLYASSAKDTAKDWTHFFGKADRPKTEADVTGYVISEIKKQICDPDFTKVLADKSSDAIRQQVEANLKALRETAEKTLVDLEFVEAAEVACK